MDLQQRKQQYIDFCSNPANSTLPFVRNVLDRVQRRWGPAPTHDQLRIWLFMDFEEHDTASRAPGAQNSFNNVAFQPGLVTQQTTTIPSPAQYQGFPAQVPPVSTQTSNRHDSESKRTDRMRKKRRHNSSGSEREDVNSDSEHRLSNRSRYRSRHSSRSPSHDRDRGHRRNRSVSRHSRSPRRETSNHSNQISEAMSQSIELETKRAMAELRSQDSDNLEKVKAEMEVKFKMQLDAIKEKMATNNHKIDRHDQLFISVDSLLDKHNTRIEGNDARIRQLEQSTPDQTNQAEDPLVSRISQTPATQKQYEIGSFSWYGTFRRNDVRKVQDELDTTFKGLRAMEGALCNVLPLVAKCWAQFSDRCGPSSDIDSRTRTHARELLIKCQGHAATIQSSCDGNVATFLNCVDLPEVDPPIQGLFDTVKALSLLLRSLVICIAHEAVDNIMLFFNKIVQKASDHDSEMLEALVVWCKGIDRTVEYDHVQKVITRCPG